MKCEHGITPWWDCDPCRGSATFGEDPIQPYIDHNLGPEPIEITSRAQRRAIMAKKHFEYHDVSKKLRGKLYIDMHR